MIIAGGAYRETCLHPSWRRLFGSGVRAAVAVSKLSPNTQLHTYVGRGWTNDFRATAATCGFELVATPTPKKIGFEYLHPLAKPTCYPPGIVPGTPIRCSGDVVLRFGFVEGDAIVSARRAIYDPQTGDKPAPFFANGSTCLELAVVLNAVEAFNATGESDLEVSGPSLLRKWRADVVVIKGGSQGAAVFTRDAGRMNVPAYQTGRVFKVGSGDVFSALFAHCWGELNMDPSAAAQWASAAVADYVEFRQLPFLQLPSPIGRVPVAPSPRTRRVYLAGPFFNLPQLWMIQETLKALESLGAEVFSPFHDVGFHPDSRRIADMDLLGLRACDVILALVDGGDPGTLHEIGYAKALDPPKPVILLAERFNPIDLTMYVGTNCKVYNDFTTAIYATMWEEL